MNNKCYTYYEKIDIINDCPSRKSTQQELIDLCKLSWQRNGWELIVLDHSIAEKHSFFYEYSDIVSSMPSINPPKYDYSCFIRWLAMAQIGGGLMIDYDVININQKSFEKTDKITVFQGHVPSVVYGTEDQYLTMCKKFCKFKQCISIYDKKPHISDMILLDSGKIDFNRSNLVVDYPENGSMVHCNQECCKKNNKTKIEAMKELLL